MVEQGGVRLNGEKLTVGELNQILFHGDVLKIGKKLFVRFVK